MNQIEPDSALSDDAVQHVAHLARLALTDVELIEAKKDLKAIFTHIDLLKSIDTSGVEPLDHPTELTNSTRDDTVGDSLTQEQVFANAPATKDIYFDVPKVLGGSA
jgi:aspartyl-tRNA(Asn)/glutamyl-tRNA(Gln) amidotransferase subunit C